MNNNSSGSSDNPAQTPFGAQPVNPQTQPTSNQPQTPPVLPPQDTPFQAQTESSFPQSESPPPTPVMPNIQPASTLPDEEEVEEPKSNTWKIVLLIVSIIVLIPLVILALLYFFVYRPRLILVSAISRTFKEPSLEYSVNFENFDDYLSNISLNYKRQDNLESSELSFSIEGTESTTLKLLTDSEYTYFKPIKTNSTQTLNQLLTNFPDLAGTKGFALSQPVLFGNSWTRESSADNNPFSLSHLEGALIGTALITPLKINSFQNNYQLNQTTYKKYVLGLNKEILINIVTGLKTDPDNFTDADKADLINTLDKTQGLDNNILEVLIDNKGYLSNLVINLPPLVGEVSGVSFQDFQQYRISAFKYFYQTLINYTSKQTTSGYSKVVTATLNKHDETVAIDVPKEYVDLDKVSIVDKDTFWLTVYSVISDHQLYDQSTSQSNLFSTKSHETKLLFDKGSYSEMLASANDLLSLAVSDKEKAISYYWIGLAQYRLNNLSSAEQSLTSAVNLDPEYAAPYVTLASISYQKGEFQKGLDQSKDCVLKDPNYAWCYNNVGLGYLYLGNKDLGIENLEKAVALDPLTFIFQDNLNRAKTSQ